MVRCPYCGRTFELEMPIKSKAERKRLILENLNTDFRRATEVYRVIRSKGYSMKQKTFQRDLKELEETGVIIKETTYIKKV
jgi:DNA-binding HxlR family transcriptional regulator